MPSATAFFPDLTPYFKLDGSRTITGPSLLALSAGNAAFDALTIRGAVGQTGKLLTLETSALADVFTVDVSGNLVVTGGLTGGAISGTTINASGLATVGSLSSSTGAFSGLLSANAALSVTGNITLSNTSRIIGGSSTTADLTFQTTSGVGATGADMHFLVGNAGATEALTILNNGRVGIGEVAPLTALDVLGGIGTQLRLGSVATDVTNKTGTIQSRHYTNSEEDFGIFVSIATSTNNSLNIGGGSGVLNAATIINFLTGANNTTTTGTERLRIDASGRFNVWDGGNFALGTTTGTKWGNTNLQKQSWWNATPVIQDTGWSTSAAFTNLKSFDPTAATLDDLRRVVGTLLNTMKTYGLLGA